MDLLRLVLCYQNVNKLLALPRLCRDQLFLEQRAATRDYFLRGDLAEDAAKAGEISPKAKAYVRPEMILSRTLFLQNRDLILDAIDKTDQVDFWVALESGIPEVQAKALAAYEFRHKGNGNQVSSKALNGYNDLTAIPWTERLEKLVSSFLIEGQKGSGSTLAGFLHVPLKYERRITFPYFIGYCMHRLSGGETTEEIPELTRLYTIVAKQGSLALSNSLVTKITPDSSPEETMKAILSAVLASGYITPCLEWLRKPIPGVDVAKMAVKNASLIALREIAKHHPQSLSTISMKLGPQVLTTRYRKRVQAILQDKDLCSRISGTVIAMYRIILHGGKEAPGNLSTPLGKSEAQVVSDAMSGRKCMSLQGISFHDPLYLYASLAEVGYFSGDAYIVEYLCLADAYRRGQYLAQHAPRQYDFARKPRVAPVERYRKILAYLRGDAEKWQD